MPKGSIAFFLLAFAVLALAAATSPRWAGVVAGVLALLAIVLVLVGVIPA
jgi:hypothetical protein